MSTDPNTTPSVPVIDMRLPKDELIHQIVQSCSEWGFFQLVHHSIHPSLLHRFRHQMKLFFELPHDIKHSIRRNESNARGYFDDELTKQRRDWKECLDVGVPGSRDWDLPDDDLERNSCLDGLNQFPPPSSSSSSAVELDQFRSTVVEYFQACSELSRELALLMSLGLGVKVKDQHEHESCHNHDHPTQEFQKASPESLLTNLKEKHSSYLRMNYYPPYRPDDDGNATSVSSPPPPPPLGISPHTDAGFLTVLIQDDDCHSLQVAKRKSNNANTCSTSNNHHSNREEGTDDMDWFTVKPIPGAVTINTGDMAMIWSNGLYNAPLHRVLTNPQKKRYSAPFFYNPGYDAIVSPLSTLEQSPKYHPCSWGYFRAVRFAGDLTDIGAEVQISDFEIQRNNNNSDNETNRDRPNHLEKQKAFLKVANFGVAFSVERYRPMLEGSI